MAFERHLTDEDSALMQRFNDEWRAAGWGSWVDCWIDKPYGVEDKFFGALFLPEHHDRLLAAQYEDALAAHRSIRSSPLDRAADRLPPAQPTLLRYETVFESPNLVTGPTASRVCIGAILRAKELYPRKVPRDHAELIALSATAAQGSTE